jgi:hypothetical protein
MPNPIKLKRSAVADAVPSSLEFGELALNYNAADGKLFYKNSAGVIVAFESGGGEDSLLRSLFVPPAPTSVSASAGNAQATVSWTAPSVLAQTPITDYLIQYSANSGSSWTTFSRSASAATTASVTGLTNNTAYVFRVAAITGIGTGAFSTASTAVTPVAGDPLWANVQLLLPGDTSTNDASSYSRSVSATGATVSTAQKKFGAGSIYFDGSGGRVVAAASSAFNFGSGDFVIEGWVYFNSVASDQRVAGGDNAASTGNFSWAWYTTQSGRLDYYLSSSGSSWNLALSQPFGTIATGQWYHVALVRSGSTVTPYLNGTAGTATNVSSASIYHNSSNGPFIGTQASSNFSGFIDDFRITVGSDRSYTGATIAVPTAAFPTVGPSGVATDGYFSSVSLLLHADGTGSTFVDSSPTPKEVTATNATQSATQSKWGGKSAYFDGSGDYLTVPSSAAFDFGSGDFVVEMWVYRSGSQPQFSGLAGWNTDSGDGFYFGVGNANQLRVVWSNTVKILASVEIPNATWTHIAVVRNGSTVTAYQGGTSVGSASISGAMPYVAVDGAIGRLFSGVNDYHWTGYIDDLRITKGSNRGYTGSTITVPTAAFPDA